MLHIQQDRCATIASLYTPAVEFDDDSSDDDRKKKKKKRKKKRPGSASEPDSSDFDSRPTTVADNEVDGAEDRDEDGAEDGENVNNAVPGDDSMEG